MNLGIKTSYSRDAISTCSRYNGVLDIVSISFICNKKPCHSIAFFWTLLQRPNWLVISLGPPICFIYIVSPSYISHVYEWRQDCIGEGDRCLKMNISCYNHNILSHSPVVFSRKLNSFFRIHGIAELKFHNAIYFVFLWWIGKDF